jgi:hypothetical protein
LVLVAAHTKHAVNICSRTENSPYNLTAPKRTLQSSRCSGSRLRIHPLYGPASLTGRHLAHVVGDQDEKHNLAWSRISWGTLGKI